MSSILCLKNKLERKRILCSRGLDTYRKANMQVVSSNGRAEKGEKPAASQFLDTFNNRPLRLQLVKEDISFFLESSMISLFITL